MYIIHQQWKSDAVCVFIFIVCDLWSSFTEITLKWSVTVENQALKMYVQNSTHSGDKQISDVQCLVFIAH